MSEKIKVNWIIKDLETGEYGIVRKLNDDNFMAEVVNNDFKNWWHDKTRMILYAYSDIETEYTVYGPVIIKLGKVEINSSIGVITDER